jgi:alpha-D-ribose 1-methylphosphonate 5-triphosphate synthase subunit PhnH
VIRALDHTGSQRVFRVLLDALSRPGTVHDLPAGLVDPVIGGGAPAAVLVPLALADLEVTLAVLATPGPDRAAALATATGARTAPAEAADLVLALRPPRPDEVRGLRRGTPDRPDLACRLVLACAGFDGGAHLELTGPGVDGTARLAVDGVPVEALEALVAVNRRYPVGVDTFLVDPAGRVAGLPRSTAVRITSGAGSVTGRS